MSWTNARDLRKEFELLYQDEKVRRVDRLLKDFWATGLNGRFERHTIHLAHGYSHIINVANITKDISKALDLEPETAFITGLLHDAYRPIERGGMEPHGKICERISKEILRTSGLFDDDLVRQISGAIRTHDLGVPEEQLMLSPLGKAIFIADKSNMNIERVMAYVYDSMSYNGKVRYKPSKHFTLLDVIITDLYGKFARDSKLLITLGRSEERLEEWCKKALEAYENTMQELYSQRDKESRKEDFPMTIRLFWAFKEAISNFRYLTYSEREVYGKKDEDLYRSVHTIIGRYRQLLLTELDHEPFKDILEYRHLVSQFSFS